MPITTDITAATCLFGSAPLPYAIYTLVERSTGRHYVGLTSRPLAKRISAHRSQARRNRKTHPNGLMIALRRTLDAGRPFEKDWDVRVVARVATTNEAREMERHWIAALSAASPSGFNIMPGGRSVGGPDNVVSITVVLPDGSRRTYACIQDAVAESNTVNRDAGMPTLLPGTAYARIAMGWPPAEALGYAPHEDGRGARPPITVEGHAYGNLRSVSAATGVGVATLRSRLHRRTLSGSTAGLATDMRRTGTDHIPTRSAPLSLRLPGEPATLTVREYAARTGTPASTIQHRWHATCRAGLDPATLSPVALLERLMAGKDRRRLLTLRLPDGRSVTGGERELVRQVLSDPGLAASRTILLSESGVRRRLRLLPECDRQDPSKVMVAFGFGSCGGGI